MSNVIEKLARAGYLNREQVLRVQKEVEKFKLAYRQDPEFRKEAQARLPGFGERFISHLESGLPGLLLTGGVTLLGTAFQDVARDAYQSVKGSLMKGKYYKNMIDQYSKIDPNIKKYDPAILQAHFNTLYNLNPEMAADPLVAGSHVVGAAAGGGVNIGTADTLINMRRNMAAAKGQGPIDFSRLLTMPIAHPVHPEQLEAWKGQAAAKDRKESPEQIALWRAQAEAAREQAAAAQEKRVLRTTHEGGSGI